MESCLRSRLVLPVYNECHLVEDVSQALEEASRRNPQLRLVVVDDGSKDGTGSAFRQRLHSLENAEVIILPKNGGKGHAIRNGFRDAQEEYLMFTDGDLAYSLDYLTPLVNPLRSTMWYRFSLYGPPGSRGTSCQTSFSRVGIQPIGMLASQNRLSRYAGRFEGL